MKNINLLALTLTISEFDKGKPYITPFDHPVIQAAGRSYEKVYDVPTAYTRGGGSIPIVAAFDEILAVTSCANGLRFNE